MQFGGAYVARTDEVLLDTLVGGHSTQTRCIFAGIAIRAVGAAGTGRAAEGAQRRPAVVLVRHAAVFTATEDVVAITLGLARLANSWESWHTDVDDVTAHAGELRTFETRIAPVAAQLAALFAAVDFDAKTAVALGIFAARAGRFGTTRVLTRDV